MPRDTFNNSHTPGSKLRVFSKEAAIWVVVLAAVIAFGVLLFVYSQGGLPHVVHQ
ncbi:MAG TPA: hypothetical protein VHW09_06870 [Bryobacteraceae bacterium]|nr:hypothetical protein [Bryobacteraceae bacterium]